MAKIVFTGNVFPWGPGHAYGGERILGYLSEALIKLGHELYIFATEGTIPAKGAKDFVPVQPMRNDTDVYFDVVKEYIKRTGVHFDIYHTNYFGEGWNPETLTIADHPVELVWNRWCHMAWQLKQTPYNVVSYSKVLQQDFFDVGVKTTMIHYGLPKDLYQFSPDHDGYAVWIGKIEGGKRPDLAIKLALAAGLKIVIMGPPYNTTHFWQMVAPYIDGVNIFWVRGVDDEMKGKIMRRAKVFISSNDPSWTEHFGLVNIEALACGTPIIAFNRTNRPSAIMTDKIITDEKHGFYLNYESSDDDEAIIEKGIPLLNRVVGIERKACREQFEARFTSSLMAQRFSYLYDYISEHGNVKSLEIPF